MRTIRVTYRAVFAGPKPPINPSNWHIPGTFPVEIFQSGSHWKAREIATARRVVYTMLMDFGSAESGQKVVERAFATRLQDWQIWGTPPSSLLPAGFIAQERILVPGVDICDCGNGEWGWYGPEDRTHIARPNAPTAHGKAQAACTAVVSTKIIVSTRANVEPSCPECAEIYRKEFQHA